MTFACVKRFSHYLINRLEPTKVTSRNNSKPNGTLKLFCFTAKKNWYRRNNSFQQVSTHDRWWCWPPLCSVSYLANQNKVRAVYSSLPLRKKKTGFAVTYSRFVAQLWKINQMSTCAVKKVQWLVMYEICFSNKLSFGQLGIHSGIRLSRNRTCVSSAFNSNFRFHYWSCLTSIIIQHCWWKYPI